MPRKDGADKGRTEATDGQIDALVYELYDLTEEEIRIVEAANKKSESKQVFNM